MLWAILSVASVGIFLGLSFRAASIVGASIVLAGVSTVLLPLLTEWSLLLSVGVVFALLTALQGGYLVGALISSQARARSSATSFDANEPAGRWLAKRPYS